MAVLEKIRVKLGVFITALIALALLSFIIDPSTLESTMSMFSSKYDVGEIDGKSISYQEFQKKVEYFNQIYEITSGSSSVDETTQEMLNNTAWQDEIAEIVLIPAAGNAGIKLGESELLDMSQGSAISPVLANEAAFRDENGNFDKARLVQFVQAVPQDQSGQLQLYWSYLEDNMVKDQMFTKYISLLEKSNYVTPLELAKAIEGNNTTYSVDFTMTPIGFGTDSTIVVSNSEIENYYKTHKNYFRQQEAKDIEYAVFEVLPSAEDMSLAQKQIEKVYDEFVTTDNVKTFLARNSDVQFNPYYFSEDELKAAFVRDISDFAVNAKVSDVLPVFQDEYNFMAARITDIKSLPDSVFVKHILLPVTDKAKADSLLNVVKKGGNFAQIAQEYSLDKNPNVEEAGDLGWMTQRYMIPGFENVISAKVNDVMLLNTSYGIHIVKITKATKPLKKYQVAVLTKEAVAGKQTYADYYAKANDLATASEGSLEKFRAAAKEQNVNIYPAMKVLASAKTIGTYEKAKEVVRWLNENKEGSASGIISVNNQYFFVAAITKEYHRGFAEINDVAPEIRQTLLMEKRAEKIAQESKNIVAGATTIEEVGEKLGLTVSHQTGVTFSSLTSQQLDPKFVGAVAAAKEGELTGPVVGDIGVYYFTVSNREVGAFYTEDDAKTRKNQEFAYIVRALPAIMAEGANVVDLRYKFY